MRISINFTKIAWESIGYVRLLRRPGLSAKADANDPNPPSHRHEPPSAGVVFMPNINENNLLKFNYERL